MLIIIRLVVVKPVLLKLLGLMVGNLAQKLLIYLNFIRILAQALWDRTIVLYVFNRFLCKRLSIAYCDILSAILSILGFLFAHSHS